MPACPHRRSRQAPTRHTKSTGQELRVSRRGTDGIQIPWRSRRARRTTRSARRRCRIQWLRGIRTRRTRTTRGVTMAAGRGDATSMMSAGAMNRMILAATKSARWAARAVAASATDAQAAAASATGMAGELLRQCAQRAGGSRASAARARHLSPRLRYPLRPPRARSRRRPPLRTRRHPCPRPRPRPRPHPRPHRQPHQRPLPLPHQSHNQQLWRGPKQGMRCIQPLRGPCGLSG